MSRALRVSPFSVPTTHRICLYSLEYANAVLAKLVLPEKMVTLGHIKRSVAGALAPLMDGTCQDLLSAGIECIRMHAIIAIIMHFA